MPKPRLLDLFAGAGGAARGYQLAGFHVTGVDIKPQPRYVGDEFHQADAMTFPLDGYDAIHASPPCHDHSALATLSGHDGTGWILSATRIRLVQSGLPYVIENVEGARAAMRAPALFCGGAFDLGAVGRYGRWMPLRRHRLFESNVFLPTPGCGCSSRKKLGVYGHGGGVTGRRGYQAMKQEAANGMGIDWMNRDELAQAIPPLYTAFVGEFLLQHVRAVADA